MTHVGMGLARGGAAAALVALVASLCVACGAGDASAPSGAPVAQATAVPPVAATATAVATAAAATSSATPASGPVAGSTPSSAATALATAVATAAATPTVVAVPASGARAADCPNGGTVRYGVEPFEESAQMLPAFQPLADALAKNLGCKVELSIPTNYNAEIEAMRAGKLDAGEFGPFGYVLAHQVAKAEAVATYSDKQGNVATYTASIVTWPGSGITDLKGVEGRSFAYSDPASTSGHLFPAYALKKAGIDPDKGVKAIYAGSHTSSFEALRNHKVDAGELNSSQMASAKSAGTYKDGQFTTLWKSDPIPQDPIAVRGDLPDAFKQRFTHAILAIDISTLPQASQKAFADCCGDGGHFVPQNDAAFDGLRDLVKVLNLDLAKLS